MLFAIEGFSATHKIRIPRASGARASLQDNDDTVARHANARVALSVLSVDAHFDVERWRDLSAKGDLSD